MYWLYFHTFTKLKQKQLSQCWDGWCYRACQFVPNERMNSKSRFNVRGSYLWKKMLFYFQHLHISPYFIHSKRMKCVRLRKNEHGFKWWTVKWWEVSYEIVRSARWNGEDRAKQWFKLLHNGIKSTIVLTNPLKDVWQERNPMLITF